MANNCSITLKKDKDNLPKLINKMEFFIFRAMEREGIDFFKIASEGKRNTVIKLLNSVKEKIIPSYINEYKEQVKLNQEEGDLESAKDYENAVANLQNMLVVWKQLVPNFLNYSTLFNIRTKFSLDEDGLVDLSDVADDDNKMLKAMVFDKPSNEIDPLEQVDKAVELFLRSIPVEDEFDEYGWTSSIDYASFVRNLFVDLENSTGMDEIISKLEKNKEKTPQYQYIIDKLTHKPGLTREESRFRINFRNSFIKAFIPIYTVSIEDGKVIKVFEAAMGKKSLYEKILSSNFAIRGMEITQDGKKINLASRQDGNGPWVLTKEDIPNIKKFLEEGKDSELKSRQIEFLKGLGFEFSKETEEFLAKTSFFGKGNSVGFNYIKNHLFAILENKPFITNPISELKKDIKTYNKEERKYTIVSAGQNNSIAKLIDAELQRNPSYNVERSMINSEGNRQHAIQLHNNFTVLNKYFSDPEAFPTLQDIINNEPSMFWMDPNKNPNVRNSVYLNSLFFFNPSDPNFGKRRRVDANGKWSTTEGEFVKISIVNTGGLQVKLASEFIKEGSSSTGLNEIDKLLQDINLFRTKKFNSMLRLGDKSTDLGMGLNYYVDPNTGEPTKKPIGESAKASNQIFKTEAFLKTVKNALQDTFEMKYLRKQGFLSDMSKASKNLESTWGYFDGILSSKTKTLLNELVKDIPDIEDTDIYLDAFSKEIEDDITEYFNKYAQSFLSKFDGIRKNMGINSYGLVNHGNFEGEVYYYLANSFITDLEQMKVFFGDAIFFKDFHKRASKDSATGIFTFVDDDILSEFNDHGNKQGWGYNTNLSGRRLIERLYQEGKITKEQRDEALVKQGVQKSFKSGVIKDVNFKSLEGPKILKNIETLKKEGYITEEMARLFENSLSNVISKKYSGTEADGQGKCTFDFYRIMSILTGPWTDDQERVYNKIVEYNHYDELADNESDPNKKAEYIMKRNAVGYDPKEAVYFPPKKFQYSGPQNYTKMIGTEEYSTYIPIFDKFSLQPLIPTVTKGTADHELLRKMEFNGLGYVKFESGSKTEAPKTMDEFYENYDENKPDVRSVKLFDPSFKFKSEQELFFNHFKEQVAIDAEIHDHAVFGSQIRKLIMMNLSRPEFKPMYEKYKTHLGELAELEKTALYNEMGITRDGGKLKVGSLNKLVDYFFKEISKKNQDSNVRKALKYDEATGKFEIPLDGAVQAQIIEGIIISAINNKIVRYKTNGSMLIQMAITGSDKLKFDRAASEKALETYGNTGLKYYDVTPSGRITKMDVKIAMTGQWLNLLNLTHPDGYKIGSIERMNQLLKDEEWVKKNEKSLTMVSYRIPTQGRNFLDSMVVKEFLPASVGDAIIMPSEVVIKSGSDFDIDKMFTLYPNLNADGSYATAEYNEADIKDPTKYKNLKGAIQNKVYEVMSEVILHPANYMELVTPSENYHILPIVDKIYKKLNPETAGKEREKTDFKNSDILNREKNIRKFLSLLKGKNDLGIAAVANTFNVLFQLSKARGNMDFFSNKSIGTFFECPSIAKRGKTAISNIDYSGIFDEDGALKSEFFSEFINAFVDVAKDDYIFAVNVVTELSPLVFYMKYAGLSSEKILNFVNQPSIRYFTKQMMVYQNKFVKSNGIGVSESARRKAFNDTIKQLGYYNKEGKTDRNSIMAYITQKQAELGITNLSTYFTADSLEKGIQPDKINISEMSEKGKLIQLAMMLEMENLKVQSNSLTEAQKFLNFDTNPFASTFDVYARNSDYVNAISGNSILNKETLQSIKQNSIISHLDVSRDIAQLLSDLFPIRNDIAFNKYLLQKANILRNDFNNPNVVSQDDMLKFARTAKNDYITYILQNHLDSSAEGKKFFQSTFDTTQGFNEYMKELVETNKLSEMLYNMKALPYYERLASKYPFIRNIIVEPGENNNKITTFKIAENGSNPVEKEKIISDFEELTNLENPEYKPVRDFFRNLALYSTFQSGLNTSQNSYTSMTPVDLVNKLYGYAIDNYNKTLVAGEKTAKFDKFYRLFVSNNPTFFNMRSSATLTREKNDRGKWYSEDVKLNFDIKKQPAPKQVMTPVNTKATVVRYDGTLATKEAARRKEGVYVMTPNPGDGIPGVDENYNFGNPWNHKGYQNKIKTDTIEEAVANYEKWLRKEDFLDVDPERRDWILGVINAGRLDNKNLLYFASGFRSHADALADFINSRDKTTTLQRTFKDEELHQAYIKGGLEAVKKVIEKNKKTELEAAKTLAQEVKLLDEFEKLNSKSNKSNSENDKLIELYTLLKNSKELDFNYSLNQLAIGSFEVKKEGITGKIAEWIEKELPWKVETPHSEIAAMYEKEKLSGETIEEFLNRLSCLGKLI